jgi:hypothetical protein
MTVVVDLVNTSGTSITSLTNARCLSVTRQKNVPDKATIIFPKAEYSRDDVHVFTDDTGTGDLHEIRVMRDDRVIFWGPAIQADANSHDGHVTLTCVGVDYYLTRRYIDAQRTNLATNGSLETGDETGWTFTGSMTHAVTTDDAVRGTHSERLTSLTPLGDIFMHQTVTITGTGVGTVVTVSAWFKIESIGGHALDRRGLYVEGIESGVFKTNNAFYIDEHMPVGTFQRATTNIRVPPLTTWTLDIRQYSPPGSILWDELEIVEMQSVSTAGITGDTTTPVDVGEIVGLIHAFVQNPTYGKSDVNIDLDNPTVGVKQVKHIQWASHTNWRDQMAEWINAGYFDYSMVNTETTRTLVLHVPKQGVDRTSGGGAVTLTYPGNVASYTVVEDGNSTVSDDTELDQNTGTGPDREEGHFADSTQIGGLTLQAVNAAPTQTAIAALDPLAAEEVDKSRRPPLLYTFTLTNKDGTNYDELLGLGDQVLLATTDGWSTMDGNGTITQIVETPATRNMQVTVARTVT